LGVGTHNDNHNQLHRLHAWRHGLRVRSRQSS
jgi:hypothetical protein